MPCLLVVSFPRPVQTPDIFEEAIAGALGVMCVDHIAISPGGGS